MSVLKRRRGSAIAFSTVLAFALVILGVGFFFLYMYMGAQNETKNATDSGALNLGRKVVDDSKVTVIIAGDKKEEFFRDVTDGPVPGVGLGKVNLTNIDRIWGKALFVAINAKAAGGAAGDVDGNIQSAFEGAQSISDKLSAKLTNESNLHEFFEEYSKQNSTRMIAVDSKVSTMSGPEFWQTSLMDRGKESNIEVTNNLPVNYALPGDYVTPTTRTPVPSGAQNKKYLKGYFPLEVKNQTFWTVPFQFDAKPHLVSKSLFDADKKPPHELPSPWNKAVPNAFSVGGKVITNGPVPEKAMSWVQTNPRRVFPLQFPNGFIRIVVKQNKLQWRLMGIPMDSTTYESQPETIKNSGNGIPYPIIPICSTVSGEAHMGLEYIPPTLIQAINGNVPPFLPGSPVNKQMRYLLQRCKEMVPDCTMSDLWTALSVVPMSSSDKEQKFYIFPAAGKIIATPESIIPPLPGTNSDADPEGSVEWTDTSTKPLPNFFTEQFTCNGVPAPKFPVPIVNKIKRTWKPGTGYQGGCLGEMTIEHTNDAIVIILPCVCPI